jgi:hypothetical protein
MFGFFCEGNAKTASQGSAERYLVLGVNSKMMGGGGLFQLVRIFFLFFACVDNFFKYNPLHEFFFISTYNFPYFSFKLFGARIFFFLFPLLDFCICECRYIAIVRVPEVCKRAHSQSATAYI